MITTATASSPAPPRFTRILPCTSVSIATARHLTRGTLARWGLHHLVEVGALLVSELVTNSVVHTESPSVRVTLSHTAGHMVRLAVVDASHALPVLRESSDADAHGRGLVLVQALSAGWGAEPLPSGKSVWADLPAAFPVQEAVADASASSTPHGTVQPPG